MRKIFPLFIIIAALFLGLLHAVIYQAVVLVLAIQSPFFLLGLKIILTLLALSFITATVLANYANNCFSRSLYKFSVIWMGLAVYLFLASVIYGLVMGITLVIGTILKASGGIGWIHGVNLLGAILLLTAIIVTIYGLIHATKIRKTTVSVSLPNLPASWKGRRAVLVSDLHLGQIRGRSFARKIAQKIAPLNPDIIFIAGDLYDGVKVHEADIISPLKELKPSLGMYFVTGNHEEFRDNGPFLKAIADAGIRTLVNEAVDIEGVTIIGVDDHDSRDKNNFGAILEKMSTDKMSQKIPADLKKPLLLLKHQPDFLDIAEKAGISLQLSGHTHRAQIFPFTWITRLMYGVYEYGLHAHGTMQVYTSSGVGTWGPPLRVGTNAEIVEITLRDQ